MAYARHFIPLTAEVAGYEFKGRKPAGRCVLETNNGTIKVTTSTQDLRPGVRYGVYLLFNDEARVGGVAVGALTVDEKGKGDARREMKEADLHGLSPNAILGAAVLVMGIDPVESPLCGYRHERVAWRTRYYERVTQVEVVKEMPPVEVAPPVEAVVEVAPPVEEVPVACEPAPVPVEEVPVEEVPVVCEPAPVPVEEAPMEEVPVACEPAPVEEPSPVMCEPLPAEEPSPVVCEPSPVEEPSPVVCEPSPVDEPVHEVKVVSFPEDEAAPPADAPCPASPAEPRPPYMCETDFAVLKPISPFAGGDTAGAQWMRFTADDALPAPPNAPGFFDAPFVADSYDVYGHFILGMVRDDDNAIFILGVPGVYSDAEKDRAHALGITEFKCYEPTAPADGEFGYWLLGMV